MKSKFILSLVTFAAVLLAAQQPAPAPEWLWGPGLGIYASTVTPAFARDLGISQEKGLLVLAIVRGSVADQAGLKPGDVITGLAGREAWSEDKKQARIDFVHDGQSRSANVLSSEIPADKDNDLLQLETPQRSPQTFVVDPSGSGNFRTIAGALYHARVGDTITLAPGRYTESVFVHAGVTIRPAANSVVSIEPSQPWILKGPGTFDISDLIFTGTGLRIENADKAALSRDTFLLSQKKNGVLLLNSHNVMVAKCNFRGAGETSGIAAYTSQFTVADSVFADNGNVAISIAEHSQADIQKNLMEANHNGISARDSGVNAQKNIITGDFDPDKKDNSGIGLRAENSAAAFANNAIRRYYAGLVLVNGSSPAKISGNTVTQGMHAVVILSSGAALNKNLIVQNGGDGLYVGLREKEKQLSPQEVTINQNTISQNEGTAIRVQRFNHLTITENLIEANHWGITADHASVSLENNTVVLQRSTAINIEGPSDARIYNNIVAFNGFGLFLDVASHRESGYNDVFGNLVNTDFPLHDGNYGRSDRYITRDNRKVPIEVYPAYDLKARTDLDVDPGFVKVGSNYTLKPASALARIRGKNGRYLGAYASSAVPVHSARPRLQKQ